MPVVIRMDRRDVDALLAWVRERIEAAERSVADDGASRAAVEAHRAILGIVTPHLGTHGTVGQLADSTLQRLALAYRHEPGYVDDWRP